MQRLGFLSLMASGLMSPMYSLNISSSNSSGVSRTPGNKYKRKFKKNQSHLKRCKKNRR